VVVGSGTAGAEFLRHYKGEVTVVSPTKYLFCQALFPSYVAGKIEEDELKVDLQPFFEHRGIIFRKCKVEFVKQKCKTLFSKVKTVRGIGYDICIIAIGGTNGVYVEGVEKTLSINDFESAKIARKRIEKAKDVVVVGSGMSGVEVAYEISDFCNVTLIEAEKRVLPNMCEKASKYVKKLLENAGVDILTSCKVEKISDTIMTSCGEIEFDEVLWCTGIVGKRLAGLKYGKYGILVNSSLKAGENIFVIGDAAEVKSKNGIATKTALEAERQAKFVAKAIKKDIKNLEYKPFSTIENPFSIITLGNRAILVRGNTVISGDIVHKLKNYVVRRFLKNFEV